MYNDSGGTVTGKISDNHFRATGGTVRAFICGGFTGHLRDNNLPGWAAKSVSEKIVTTGTSVNPGLIGAGATVTLTFTVNNASLGDIVIFGPMLGAWPVVVGIEIRAFVSAANTVSVSYRNFTAGGLTPAAHDIYYSVEK
jgi:hypothetical protein